MTIRLKVLSEPKPSTIIRRGPAHVVGLAGAPTGSSSPIGSTYWKRVRRCPREHALHEVAQLRGFGDDEALTVGFLVHHGLEVFYRTIWEHQRALEARGYDTRAPDHHFLYGAVQAATAAAWEALRPVSLEPGYTEKREDARLEPTWDVVERCLAHYFERWSLRDRWRILAVEETLQYIEPVPGAPLVQQPPGDVERGWLSGSLAALASAARVAYSARLDLIVEDYDRGGTWVVEHKTARNINRDLLEGYQLDLQTLGQVWLMRRCVDLSALPHFKGVIVNIVSKQKTPQLDRVEVCPSEQHLASFERSIYGWKVIERVQRELGYPHAFGACTGPDRGYRRCTFFDLCHSYPLAAVEAFMQGSPPDGFMRLASDVIDVDFESYEG